MIKEQLEPGGAGKEPVAPKEEVSQSKVIVTPARGSSCAQQSGTLMVRTLTSKLESPQASPPLDSEPKTWQGLQVIWTLLSE